WHLAGSKSGGTRCQYVSIVAVGDDMEASDDGPQGSIEGLHGGRKQAQEDGCVVVVEFEDEKGFAVDVGLEEARGAGGRRLGVMCQRIEDSLFGKHHGGQSQLHLFQRCFRSGRAQPFEYLLGGHLGAGLGLLIHGGEESRVVPVNPVETAQRNEGAGSAEESVGMLPEGLDQVASNRRGESVRGDGLGVFVIGRQQDALMDVLHVEGSMLMTPWQHAQGDFHELEGKIFRMAAEERVELVSTFREGFEHVWQADVMGWRRQEASETHGPRAIAEGALECLPHVGQPPQVEGEHVGFRGEMDG
ncbi:MAG: hypothetical protein U1E22_04820, partial [Coriobacteriia bacterium]|nr:hypothetical protein [Coriobacteriia bacterium]